MIPPRVADRTFLIVGLGRSGCAAAALLRRHGAQVIGADDADLETLAARWEAAGLAGQAAGAFAELLTEKAWHRVEPARLHAVVLSPGVPPDHLGLARLRQAGLPVHGELEWSSRFFGGRTVAVTGTNGKSTVTAWIAHVLAGAGRVSPALGNLGNPLANLADQLAEDAVPVIECSSFQLETIETFRPTVGVVLNLAPDHLDRYPNAAAYYAAKARLARQVAADGWFITWTECPAALAWPTSGSRRLFGDPDAGAVAWYADGWLRVRHAGRSHAVLPIADLSLQSPPNLVNALATAAAALPLVDDPAALVCGLSTFGGLAHRHELVGRLGGIRFVNDSKATNVHAVCAGLRDYPGPVVLIAGGSGKGEDYTPLREVMGSVRHVVTIGREGPAIAAALAGVVPVSSAADLPAAVAQAAALAAGEATVLLSPACASFDMFRDYRQRGDVFAAAARALGTGKD
ncbi:MAG: UDP-N-acetylmuramoyl-L-alanine--D-glutamate ligase [Candidatus Krumholzibacteria bacterium]|jgi:UDP-N-acetylmuramoylalanine--D-glutamate ligase|nr:UDP-N-acetylmuramoyl-L-alanine--D-glutamate ligase [Candidatus Krumholzibacteria bacterium]